MKSRFAKMVSLLLSALLLLPCLTAIAAEVPNVISITVDKSAMQKYPMTFEIYVQTSDNARSAKLMDENDQQFGSTINAEDNGDGTKIWTIEATMEKPRNLLLTAYVQDYDKLWHQSVKTLTLTENGSTSSTVIKPEGAEIDWDGASATSGKSWDTETWETYFVRPAKISSKRFYTRNMPDKSSDGAGSYVTKQIQEIRGLFLEQGKGSTWVYVDMLTKNNYHRRLYINPDLLEDTSELPEMKLVAHPAKVTRHVVPVYGPGNFYDKYPKLELEAGQRISVFHEEDDYVYAEFALIDGTYRGWLPVSVVEAE